MYITKPEDHLREMKKLASFLQPFSPPKYPQDEDITWLKQRDVIIDGYQLVVHYAQSDHDDTRLDVLTVGCKISPSLPLKIVCKVAEMFLGKENLTLFEITKSGRKIYSWMVMFREGKAIINTQMNLESFCYNGFTFFRAPLTNKQEVTPLSDGE
jgi:hypothetical protein